MEYIYCNNGALTRMIASIFIDALHKATRLHHFAQHVNASLAWCVALQEQNEDPAAATHNSLNILWNGGV